MSESTYPYVENVEHDYDVYNEGHSLLCAFNEDKVVGKINRIVEIPEGDEEALMEAVANKVARDVEYWMDNWTVSDVIGHAGVIGQYLANAIISDKSK